MAEQPSLGDAYNNALDELTRVIREQFRLMEDINDPARIEYQRRINREIADFTNTWGVAVTVEAPGSQRISPAMFLNPVPRESLGEDAQDNTCNICYYPFFKARGRHEAEAIRNGTMPRPDNENLEPHEVTYSDLPELPVSLPCGHIFGHICVRVWTVGVQDGIPATCPICRAAWSLQLGQVTIAL